MKSLITTFIALLPFVQGVAQSATQNDITVNAGVGFGVGSVKSTFENDSSSTAVPGLLNVAIGYAITDDLFGGVRLERNGYVTNAEDSSKVVSINPGVFVGYHLLNGEKANFHVIGYAGTSSLTFTSERPVDVENNVFSKGKAAFHFSLEAGTNVYFSENVGWFFNAGFARYTYGKLVYHNDASDPTEWTFTEDGTEDGTPVKLTFSSVNIRTGIALKF